MIVIQIHKVNFQIGPWFFKFVDYLPYNLFSSSICWMVLSHWFVMTSYDNNLSLLLFSENNNSRIIIEVSTHTDTIVNNSDILSKQQIFIELWKPFVNLRSSEKKNTWSQVNYWSGSSTEVFPWLCGPDGPQTLVSLMIWNSKYIRCFDCAFICHQLFIVWRKLYKSHQEWLSSILEKNKNKYQTLLISIIQYSHFNKKVDRNTTVLTRL